MILDKATMKTYETQYDSGKDAVGQRKRREETAKKTL